MVNLDFLQGYFQESSILDLAEIFDTANTTKCKDTIEKLKLDLLSVLQQEMSIGLYKWEVSPSGNNHIVVKANLCLLINIWGANVLFENWLFYEGELSIKYFQWIEEDNLVVFDIHYLVHNEWQKCICHFANSNFFTYFTAINKDTPIELPNDTSNENDIFDVDW